MLALVASPHAQTRDPARLGKDLTGVGADPAASKDGAIPAFAPADALLPGWAPGKKRADFFKYKGDKPLYVIDASNVDKYADRLSPGQVQMVKQTKDYKMEVYPSRRSCGNPDFVVENTKKNVGTATLGADGWSLKEATVPGIPFPMPANGAEAMWNYKMKYAGIGFEWPVNYISLSPRKGSSDWIQAGATQTYYFPWGKKGSTQLSKLPPVEYYTYFAYASPVALAGQALSVVNYLDKISDTFYYFPGQRRVRRMPTYAYDAPQIGFENQYTLDEPRMFNGALDRFDWKLVGKKELIVGYNAFGMYDPSAKLSDVLKNDAPAAEARRYETHRVWVVEATVKQGVRHLAPKRTFYLDEDSWSIVVAEDYDAQGKLWKLRESFVIPVAETGSCDNPAFVQHNLIDGRYVFDQSPLGAGKDIRWVVDSKEAKFNENFYTAENLRSISER
ncbi:DUF1329 domain-containing protein [Paucibacter sp. R3-3]|uniref:DUF1329 domain-containing protein n=1 Tax=Roseateles agri TaxID=3098619 RepID=A0ABU5DG15_9BURK|nr:DUF1329 domain-containing protein [Paucibacter sp. R3-3]MDY0745225.1 DUF1329 domain-containing protein [Paucibacter sp. R3-3]